MLLGLPLLRWDLDNRRTGASTATAYMLLSTQHEEDQGEDILWPMVEEKIGVQLEERIDLGMGAGRGGMLGRLGAAAGQWVELLSHRCCYFASAVSETKGLEGDAFVPSNPRPEPRQEVEENCR